MIHDTASEPELLKSSLGNGSEGDSCAEAAITPHTIHVRDSKNTQGPRLTLAPTTWTDFVAYAAE